MKTPCARCNGPRPHRGATALAITLLLFFVMALVATFVNRNLIFEQRIAANQYRSSLAFEAAEAGLQWAEAQLNANARLDNACLASGSAASDSFRERYLSFESGTGRLAPRTWNAAGVATALHPACVRTPVGWSCSCPADGPVAALVASGGIGPFPAFSLEFLGTDKPGVVRMVATGCSSLAPPCGAGAARSADASARVEVSLGLLGALRVPPAAALTTAGAVATGDAAFSATNPDPATGIAVQAGAGVTAPYALLRGAPGAPAAGSRVENDTSLGGLGADRLFSSYFGIGKTRWKDQPAVTRVVCSSDCAGAIAQATTDRSSSAMVWVDGDVDLVGPAAFGTSARPVVLVVDGALRLHGEIAVDGLLYAGSIRWDGVTAAGTAQVRGATISEGDYQGAATPDFRYDAGVLRRLSGFAGSFARVNGSWRDFEPIP